MMMNLWQWMLTYFYTAVALNGLLAAKGGEAVGNVYDGPETPIESDAARQQQLKARDAIMRASIEIGDTMATLVSTSLIGSYNTQILKIYDEQKRKADAQGA